MTVQNTPSATHPTATQDVEPYTGVDSVVKTDLKNPAYYFNRELSHLQFNCRVLEQALNKQHPLLERLMFLCIFGSNLDEFFEVRVANLKEQFAFGRVVTGPDGMHPDEQLREIRSVCQAAVQKQYQILNDDIIPALEKEGIRLLNEHQWNDTVINWTEDLFNQEVLPVISPIGLDPAHPFPRLVNKSLNFIVSLDGEDAFGRKTGLAIIPAPRSLPRLIRLPNDLGLPGDNFINLAALITKHASDLFPGMTIKGCYQFRVTRDADLDIEDDLGDDVGALAHALRGGLHARHYGDGVRLEINDDTPKELEEFLLTKFGLTEQDVYHVNGPVNLHRLMSVVFEAERPDLRYRPFIPGVPASLRYTKSLFDAIRQENILLLHPFQSFTPVVDVLRQAAKDPNVLAIKQTLYRTGARSEIVKALIDAARNGKEVTVVVELRARFDEEDNLSLASMLQEAGAVVVYGVVGYKTHAKMMLIVRKEKGRLQRYVHLGTGNYHAGNARLYTDYSFLSSDCELGTDVHNLFQQLTGMGKTLPVSKISHAPFTLHKNLIQLINKEIENAKKGCSARIIAKANGLTEPKVIQALYRASQAGVKVQLIIRGICCLKPGIPGLSENIEVRSIIGRFLEHTRAYYFENAGKPRTFLASADLMERNLINRVETCFPVEDDVLVKRIKRELLFYINDNTRSWILQADGTYTFNQPEGNEIPITAQKSLLESLATFG